MNRKKQDMQCTARYAEACRKPIGKITYFNYAIHFPECNQIKIGRTSDLNRRVKDHARLARKLGYTKVVYAYAETKSKAVAKATELEIRRGMRECAVPGSYEWFSGNRDAFSSVARLTRLKQAQVAKLLAVYA